MFNWAIVGSGGIANRFASTLGAEELGQLRGVLATNPSKADLFLSKLLPPANSDARAYQNLEALLKDPQVDAVYIATPHTAHFDYAKKLLQMGKPVLCEKPLTVTAAETRALIEIANHNRVFLMEALWTKTLPAWQRVRQLLGNGVIGEIDHYSADMGFHFEYDAAHRLFSRELAGGVLLDLGVYPIALVIWLSGAPTDVSATAVLGPTGVDLKTMVNLKFESQVSASFTLTTRSTTENAFWLYGSKGKLCVESLFSEGQKLFYDVGDKRIEEAYPFELNGFEYQIRESVQCINSGMIEHPSVTHKDTLSAMQVLDQVRAKIGVRYRADED